MSNISAPALSRVDQVGAAGDRELRLGAPVDDLELQPELALDAREELDAVLGRAAGLGRDQPHPRRLVLAQLVAALAERIHGALHRGVATAGRSCDSPSPSRTMRVKPSSTRKPFSCGRAISRRQLLVPRSSAA